MKYRLEQPHPKSLSRRREVTHVVSTWRGTSEPFSTWRRAGLRFAFDLCKLILLSIVAVIVILPSYAQSSTPLMLIIQGQLYRLDGETLIPYTECQPPTQIIDVPVVAPDNNIFGLRTAPNENETGTSNLWLCDHTSLMLRQITTSPALRSQPVFSADNTLLIWSETPPNEDGYQLGQFSLLDETTTYLNLPEIPEQANPDSPLEVWLSTAGVHIYSYELREDLPVEVVYTYNVEGNYLGAVDVLTVQDPSWFTVEHWQNGNQPELIVLTSQGWYLLDLVSGEQSPLEAPQLIRRPVNLENAANTLSYTFTDGVFLQKSLEDYDGVLLSLTLPEASIAQSPEGETIAYADTDLRLWERGAEIIIPNTVFGDAGNPYVAWGAFEYAVNTTVETCNGIISRPFVVGDVVQLTSTSANNLRETPSRTGNLLGQFKPNETATILAGPICADGFAWYQVDAPAALGWTVYGNETETYLAISR